MRSPLLVATLLGVAISACSVALGDDCLTHCWRYLQEVPDATGPPGSMGPPDDRFDGTCVDVWGSGDSLHPPRPTLGGFEGSSCPRQAEHDVIKKVVRAIEDPTIDALMICDPFELEVYATLVDAIAADAYEECVDFLTCNRAPWDASCDIDPFDGGQQACTIPTAETLCAEVVLGPVRQALSDLSGGPGSARPVNSEYLDHYTPKICDFVPDMAGSGGDEEQCEGDGGAADESGSDSSGMGVGPFGDIGGLVSCVGEICTVQEELFGIVMESFSVFYDEEVRAERVEISGWGGGVRLSGFDDGEQAAELLGAFGIQDGDVITHVGDVALESDAEIHGVIADIPTTNVWSVTIRRWTGSTWVVLERTVVRGE